MDAALKEKWVEALRSDKYSQGHGDLREVEGDKVVGYCCLGVLADIIDPEGWGDEAEHKFASGDGYLRSSACGLRRDVQDNLARMNDAEGHKAKSFEDIANHIEKRIKGA